MCAHELHNTRLVDSGLRAQYIIVMPRFYWPLNPVTYEAHIRSYSKQGINPWLIETPELRQSVDTKMSDLMVWTQ